jgi:NADH-quinone oxidoreductase subunit J
MNVVFYLSALVAVISTALVITRTNAMHALLYLIVSLLAVSLIFFTLGAPFIAALEVIVYAGAIMVLFLFAIMLLNQGAQSAALELQWLRGSNWVGPVILSLILLAEVVFILTGGFPSNAATPAPVEPRLVGATLFTTYLIGVELSSILLLASLVGAYHLGRRHQVSRTIQREEIEITREKELVQPTGLQVPPPLESAGDQTSRDESQYQVEKER